MNCSACGFGRGICQCVLLICHTCESRNDGFGQYRVIEKPGEFNRRFREFHRKCDEEGLHSKIKL